MEATARHSIFDLFTGTGKPEPLRHGPSGDWSRGITGKHRWTYRVAGNPAVLRRLSSVATTTEGNDD